MHEARKDSDEKVAERLALKNAGINCMDKLAAEVLFFFIKTSRPGIYTLYDIIYSHASHLSLRVEKWKSKIKISRMIRFIQKSRNVDISILSSAADLEMNKRLFFLFFICDDLILI